MTVELPLCRRGSNAWLNHEWKLGRCVRCGIALPEWPRETNRKKEVERDNVSAETYRRLETDMKTL